MSYYLLYAILAIVVILCTICFNKRVFFELFTTQVHKNHNRLSKREYPCRTKLSDTEYLEHMIPHHQVAVDVSLDHITRTKDVVLANVLRKLIWTQQYEIQMMKAILQKKVVNVSDIRHLNEPVQRTTFSDIYPNKIGLTSVECNPHFFDPVAHRAHMAEMKTDKAYIDHMIPHHQVAVDMSKRLLEHTQSDFMTYLAYRIIRSQEAEIKLLYDLKPPETS